MRDIDKSKVPLKLLSAGIVMVTLLAACSYRAWYEGFQQSAQRECLENRESCADSKSYEEYKRERDRQLEKD